MHVGAGLKVARRVVVEVVAVSRVVHRQLVELRERDGPGRVNAVEDNVLERRVVFRVEV
jgi:hypothetical protein